jgi:Tol biopolymer transport system component/tetratricopeptide (TPR) repeat protein
MAENIEQFKNYRVGEVIGRGRFAVVYKAEKLDVRKTVALKVLNPEFANRPDIREQFRDQARQQAKLSHPRLVRVEDLREEHGQFFVAMEYMPLGGLHTWITKNGMLSFRQVGVIIGDVAEALDYLHGNKIVHGDIKPGNILLIEDPTQKGVLRAKLSDLRLPRASEISQTVSENLIEVTPEYISPGQARGAPSTPLSDQYSLGIVAYEMLCGQPPFTNKSQVDLYIDHQKTRPPSLQGLNNQVTPELEQVVLRALEKDPVNRYASCGEFARALRAAVAATEQKRLSDLLSSAECLLEKGEFDGARAALKDALLIQPENEKAVQLMTRLEQQEGLSKNYQQAVDSLQEADARAHAIRKEAPDYPDDADYLNTFAPPSPPIWKQFAERWKSAGQLAGLLLLFGLICILTITAWIDFGPSQSVQAAMVATARTHTPTFTPTLTPTSTSTFTPTSTPTFTPTPTSTPIGGGSGKIAFYSYRDSNGEIYVMNADGSGQTNLTNNTSGDTSPVWSPDGKKIAFYSERDGNGEIYVMNANGSGQTNLSNNGRADYTPAWSADGKKIVFVSERDRAQEIYVMNADGSGQTNLTNNSRYDTSPVWSPDGKKIAFMSNRDSYYNYEIYVMNADGSEPTNLTNNNRFDGYPVWSPDGKKIAFYSERDRNGEIYVMNADGSGQTNLSNNTSYDTSPVWSPDGKKIAFVSSSNGNYEIYVMNANGSGKNKLTNTGKVIYWASFGWSPDGKKIAFVSSSNGNYEIYVMNADGSGLTNLSNNQASNYSPVWSP